MPAPAPAPAIAIAIALVLALGCSGPGADHDTPRPLVVGVSALRISLPVFVAQERGLFERHGVRVELRRYDTAQPLVEEVIDGRIDAGGYAALPIVLTVAGRAERGVRIATGMVEDEQHPVSVLLRRRGDPTLGSIADLRGRRIGILPTVAYRAWLELVLRHAGVDPSTVTIVNLAPPQQVTALAEGGVDALFTNDPMATAAIAGGTGERLGPAAPVPVALGHEHLFGAFLVSEAAARDRPREIDALLAALDEAIAEIHRDPAAANATMRAVVRAPERPHVQLYPPARYLTSAELDGAMLEREVAGIESLGLAAVVPRVAGWALAGSVPGADAP